MDTPQLTVSFLNAVRDIATFGIMYVVLMRYNVSLVPALVVYAGLRVAAKLYTEFATPQILAGDRRPTPSYGLAIGMVNLLLVLAVVVGVPVLFYMRFSFVAAIAAFVLNLLVSSFTLAVVKRI